jgi:propanol-preferring alcohol dehydrogenase
MLTRIGSYKQYLASPERYTTLIPDGVSDYIAGPIMCSASTAYTSIKDSRLRPGQWAVFPGGGGGVGIQGVQLAVAMGLRVVVVDTGAERRELCKKFGAEHFVDFKEVEDTASEVVKLTEGGAHAVYVTGEMTRALKKFPQKILTFSAVQSYPKSLSYLGTRIGGQVMWYVQSSTIGITIASLTSQSIGLPPAGQFHIDVNPSALISKNQSIKGTLVSGLVDVNETLDFARRGMHHFLIRISRH